MNEKDLINVCRPHERDYWAAYNHFYNVCFDLFTNLNQFLNFHKKQRRKLGFFIGQKQNFHYASNVLPHYMNIPCVYHFKKKKKKKKSKSNSNMARIYLIKFNYYLNKREIKILNESLRLLLL